MKLLLADAVVAASATQLLLEGVDGDGNDGMWLDGEEANY
jgi:hypothetical protein